jgi:parallel beta-helix repeat protein
MGRWARKGSRELGERARRVASGTSGTRLHARIATALVIASVCAFVLVSSTHDALGSVTCTKYASATGRDSNPGSADAPYRTAQYLVNHVGPGETACLLPGTYAENVTIRSGGRAGLPLTLTSAPGTRAALAGVLYVADSANDVVIEDLVLNGKNSGGSPSPQVNGDRVTFRDNEVTNEHTAICFALGGAFESYGVANDPVLEGNRIHDCGRLPATNHDHGIYLEGTRNARVTNNVIYDNADYGVHLYPDADGTYIAHNVIDGNGEGLIFAGESAGGEYSRDYSSDGNVVEYNVITNSTIRANIESWWGGPTGTGNVARLNCVWNGRTTNINTSDGGFTATNNTVADPLYVDRAAKNFTLRVGSPCTGMGPVDVASPSGDFTLEAAAGSATVGADSSVGYSLSLSPLSGFDSAVALSVSGLPPGATATFSPAAVTPPGFSELTVATSGTPAGSYDLIVSASNGGLVHTLTLTLEVSTQPAVSDFSFTAAPTSRTAVRWSSTTFGVGAAPLNGFGGPLALSVEGVPKGASAYFLLNPMTLIEPSSSTLVVETKSAKAGKYSLTITGAGGDLSHASKVTLAVKNGGVKFSTITATVGSARALSRRTLNREWIEIANAGISARWLTGWSIRDEQGHVYRFDRFRLGPGHAVRIHTGRGTNSATDRYWGRASFVWNDRGDRSLLRTAGGRIADRCWYSGVQLPYVRC